MRTHWKTLLVATLALCLVFCLTPLLTAQEATGRIVGQITDPQGLVIVGARVTVTNVATQIASRAVTDKDGLYQVLHLPIGNYTVSAEAGGFRKTVTVAYPLEINQALKIDVKLQVGTATETVEVAGDASLVETVNATVGASVTSRPVINLPLNGRDVFDLARLEPGVTDKNEGADVRGTFSVAGARMDSVTYLLDGGINNDLLDNSFVLNPNPDTVAEFRILESNYSAEYGRSGGGIVSVVMKSGGNSVHGSVFEFLRNDALNANSFFNKRNGLPRDVLKRNQFGGTIGGPIKKDKLFFFASYQGQRLTRQITNGTQHVFTDAQITGDFSQSLSDLTIGDVTQSQRQWVADFLAANPYFQPNAALAAQGTIDPSRINPVAQKYIAAGLMPHSSSGQISPQAGSKDDRNEWSGKLDWIASDKDKITATLGMSRQNLVCPFAQNLCNAFDQQSTENTIAFPISTVFHRYFLNAAYSRSFTPNVLNEFRVTAQRLYSPRFKPIDKYPTVTDLGIGTTPDQLIAPPIIYFYDSGDNLGVSYRGPTTFVDNTFSYSDTVSWMKGKHTLKFGFNYSPFQNNTLYDYYVNGEFDFYGTQGYGSGVEFADFLLGLPSEYYQWPSAPSNIRTKYFAGFAQDEWRATRNLVLTLGLRYEYSSPKYDTLGRSFSIVPGAQSTRFVNAPVGLLFPGDKGAPNGANFSDKTNFGPRIGFAWDPSGKGRTSVRGGFAINYDILKGEDSLQFNGQPPFFGFSDFYFDPISETGLQGGTVPHFSNPYTWGCVNLCGYYDDTGTWVAGGPYGMGNPFPSHPPASNIDFAANGFLPFGAGGVYFVQNHIKTPYIYQYNLSVQHELSNSLRAEVSYVGSTGQGLTGLVEANPFVLGTSHRVLNLQPGNDDGSWSYAEMFDNVGRQNYNSLQTSLKKQISSHKYFGSSYFTLGYTWAKNIDNVSGFRQSNALVPAYSHGQFRSVADMDIQHRLTFGGGWDLPFADFAPSAPEGVRKYLLKGWSFYPILSWRSGFPLDITAGLKHRGSIPGPSGAGDSNQVRVNLVGNAVTTFDPKASTDPVTNGAIYFSPNNFEWTSLVDLNDGSVPAADQRTYGTLSRNAFRGPGRANFDFAIAKTTPLVGERAKLEFRAEFFNAFNSVQFEAPDTSRSSNTFGEITSTYDPRIIQFGMRITF